MTRRPNLFIIGAPKSGTTSLWDYLNGHPDVFMSPIKEPNYFAPDMETGFKHRFRHGQDDEQYRALFNEARDERYLGEASTRYLASQVAPGLIKAAAPDARIVAMLRNPVEMIYALHNERVSQQSEDVADFEQALALDAARARGNELPQGSNALGGVYRRNARYGEQIKLWMDTFGADRVHVIVFDDFSRDTPGEFRRLLEFLGVDAGYRPPEFAIVNRSHRSRGGIIRMLFTSRLALFVRHGLMPRLLGYDRAARLARRVRHSRLVRRPNPRPPMRPELRRQLEDEFEADVALLSSLLGRDLNAEWFGRSAVSASQPVEARA